jgi:hypothetical protein
MESRDRPALSRRDMLRRTATAGVVAATGALGVACRVEPELPGAPTWLAAGFDRPALITLGGAYIATHPGEQTIMALDAAVRRARQDGWPWSTPLDLPTVVAREFAAGEIVLVDGWILSRTEARLCARMTLSPAPVGLPTDSARG